MTSMYDDISGAWKNDIGFLRELCDLSGLPAALWLPGEGTREVRWTSREEHPCFTGSALRAALEQYAGKGEPCLYLEDDTFFYGVMPIGPFRLALGPAARNPVPEETLRSYARTHGLTGPVPWGRASFETVGRWLRLIHCHFMGTVPAREEVPIRSRTEDTWRPEGDLEAFELDQSENDRSHGIGMEYERKLLAFIRNGDVEGLKDFLRIPGPDVAQITDLTPEKTKETEYLIVSIITLMTRAAAAGGLRAETDHEIGDVYLRKLARASAAGETILPIGYMAMVEFAEAVRRSKGEKHDRSYVDACKDYIQRNLRRDLQVGDIAPAIGLSRTYLSRLFRQEEGITVQQYIQKEKCRHAARMLVYSDYPIAQIAQYFGFSSQSYFGTCFQTWYGMTPNAYRKARRGDTPD